MIVTLQTRRPRSIGQVRAFVEGNGSLDHEHRDRKSAYAFVGDQLRRLGYKGLGKRDKGTVRRFLAKTTGLSEVQVDRLIRQWRETGGIEDRRDGGRGRPFERRYAAADIRVLSDVDEAFGQMSGLATCELLRRQHEVFGDTRFERLAGISERFPVPLLEVIERQRARRGQERACRAQVVRARPHSAALRRGGQRVRAARALAVPELPPAVPVRHGVPRRARQAAPQVPAGGRMTPYAKLKSLPGAGARLREGVTFADLDRSALAVSDLDAVGRVNDARRDLFRAIHLAPSRAA